MRRQWFRFSLSALLLITAAAAVWLAISSNNARRQKSAVDELSKDEVIVQFESTTVVPQWMQEAVGEDYFRNEKAIDFATNRGVKRGTNEPKATNANLEQLSALRDVETLELGNAESVTDDGLRHLGPLKQLKTLYLYGSGVRGPGLAYIEALPQLSAISLNNTKLDDSGLRHLGRMKQLTWLRLDNTNITDAGISQLVGADKLENLTLGNTNISDDGLDLLQRLAALKSLHVAGTKVTSEGVQRFKKAMPACNVSTTFGLGESPHDEPLFPEGSQPTADEMNARLNELGIDGEVETEGSMPDGPIVSLRLFSSKLSDSAVLSLLGQMPELRTLNIRRGLVGDELVKGLEGKPIKYLSLQATRVTDAGLKHLANHEHLQELILSETTITDEGLTHLHGIHNLRYVGLDGCRTTNRGAQQLREALPNW